MAKIKELKQSKLIGGDEETVYPITKSEAVKRGDSTTVEQGLTALENEIGSSTMSAFRNKTVWQGVEDNRTKILSLSDRVGIAEGNIIELGTLANSNKDRVTSLEGNVGESTKTAFRNKTAWWAIEDNRDKILGLSTRMDNAESGIVELNTATNTINTTIGPSNSTNNSTLWGSINNIKRDIQNAAQALENSRIHELPEGDHVTNLYDCMMYILDCFWDIDARLRALEQR